MSKEKIIAFEELVNRRPDLQTILQSLGDDLESIVALGQQQGFGFSVDELKAHQAEKFADDQLNNAELEQIAGGGREYIGGTHPTPIDR